MAAFLARVLLMIGAICIVSAAQTGDTALGMFALAALTGSAALAAVAYETQLRQLLNWLAGADQ